MSFNDLERGDGPRRADPGAVIHDRAFAALTKRIAVQIFKLNANVKGINTCVDALGTSTDSPSLRKKLSVRRRIRPDERSANLTEVTRELVKGSTDDIKQLAQYPTADARFAVCLTDPSATTEDGAGQGFAGLPNGGAGVPKGAEA